MQGYEPIFMLFRQMARAGSREVTYAWLLENLEAVMQMAPEMFRAQFVPGLASSFCSNERADEWEQLVQDRAEQIPGYERSLAQATESIRLCAALRDAKAQEFQQALAGP